MHLMLKNINFQMLKVKLQVHITKQSIFEDALFLHI